MAILSSDVLRGHVEAIILNSLSDGKSTAMKSGALSRAKARDSTSPTSSPSIRRCTEWRAAVTSKGIGATKEWAQRASITK